MALRCAPPMLRGADMAAARTPPKVAAPLYSTPEYREWRRIVIARAHFRCEGEECGRSDCRLYADHIVEVRDDGAKFDPANGQALCGSCHVAKTNAERRRRLGS